MLGTVFPYFISLPFAYFVYYNAYRPLRSEVIQEFRGGIIKNTFTSVWLKEIMLNKIILSNQNSRKSIIDLLKHIIHTKDIKDKAKLTAKTISNELMLPKKLEAYINGDVDFDGIEEYEELKDFLVKAGPIIFLSNFLYKKLIKNE
jgi:hypothetical protein